jgi:signal peptidase I
VYFNVTIITVSKKQFILETVESVLSSIIVLMVIYVSVALPEMVWGSSMEPNFYTKERILVERVTKNLSDGFERGEVVVLKPEGTSHHMIKRIVGIPGDIFKIYDCEVYISRDGSRFKLEEPYLDAEICTSGRTAIKEGRSLKLEEDQYVLLGDNREVSMDSRVLGVIKKDDIIGRVVFRFWPLSRTGFIK